ncbi:MAG: fumarate reductase/succinate dehydrogenase flavoprotein, partial [Nevskia sp.]|nr:fumarate reductase/succinate dehydrogenase flavoprotein [Nevskia sp.]
YGGTSAMSGGAIWIPVSSQAREAGAQDSPEEAFQYIRALAAPNVPDSLIHAYVHEAPAMLDWVQANTEVRFFSVPYTDYHAELPGGKPGWRTHMPLEIDGRVLGDDVQILRPSSKAANLFGRINWTLMEAHMLLNRPAGWIKVFLKIMWRYYGDVAQRLRSPRDRFLTLGNALVGRLRISLNKRGVPIWLDTRLVSLVKEDGRVVGAVVERDGKTQRIRAHKGVVLAAGGYERNAQMRRQYLPGSGEPGNSGAHPYNTGDAIRIGQEAGAAVRNMASAWYAPVFKIPGEESARLCTYERALPGNIIVNQSGRRFHNEAASYHISAQEMIKADSASAWAVFDARYRWNYPMGPVIPKFPDWILPKAVRSILLKAGSLDELARKMGVPADTLKRTVETFNAGAAQGKDPQFGRGEAAYDRYYGDPRITPNPNLAVIDKAPFYAFPIYSGDIGTNGGLVIDENARVLDAEGKVIAGLYASGNCTASVMGGSYPGAGSTLGPAMTFGWLAGRHVGAAG